MSYSDIFRTRSFEKEPFGTMFRGVEWLVRQQANSPRIFEVGFGPCLFRMQLQSVKRKFGSAGIFVLRQYYEPLLEFGAGLISKGSYVIDGGANQGIYTCAFAAKVGPGGMVFSFEPQAYAVECLKINVDLNGFNNTRVFEGAVSDKSGSVFLNLDGGPVAAFISDAPKNDDVIEVTSFAIDDLLASKDIAHVEFMKLDVEGAELRALTGAERLIDACKPIICIESGEKKLYDKICEHLGRKGYKPYVFDGKGALIRPSGFSPWPNVFFMC